MLVSSLVASFLALGLILGHQASAVHDGVPVSTRSASVPDSWVTGVFSHPSA